MSTVNMHEAKTRLSQLVDEAMAGADVVIAKAGKPMVRLVPIQSDPTPRKPGRLHGRIVMAEDFDETPVEVIAAFGEGSN